MKLFRLFKRHLLDWSLKELALHVNDPLDKKQSVESQLRKDNLAEKWTDETYKEYKMDRSRFYLERAAATNGEEHLFWQVALYVNNQDLRRMKKCFKDMKKRKETI